MKGRIVKGGGAPEEERPGAPAADGRKVIKRDVHSAREEGKQILAGAEGEAVEIVEKARAEADAIREKARAAGYEEGIGSLNELILQFRESRRKMLEESRDEILRLSVKIAGKILGRELEANDSAFTDVVARAMRNARGGERIQIRVNPSDMKKLKKERKRLLDELGQGKDLDFTEDPDVSAGGCVIESDLGIIDATLETQLKVIEKALTSRKRG